MLGGVTPCVLLLVVDDTCLLFKSGGAFSGGNDTRPLFIANGEGIRSTLTTGIEWFFLILYSSFELDELIAAEFIFVCGAMGFVSLGDVLGDGRGEDGVLGCDDRAMVDVVAGDDDDEVLLAIVEGETVVGDFLVGIFPCLCSGKRKTSK
jgi:hypothetical protein